MGTTRIKCTAHPNIFATKILYFNQTTKDSKYLIIMTKWAHPLFVNNASKFSFNVNIITKQQ